MQNISDCKLIQNAIKDWTFFLSKLCNDRKVAQRDFFNYYDNNEEIVDLSVMTRNKTLEVAIAFMINKTFEESVVGSNFLYFMHEYCKDHGIIFEETSDNYWQNAEVVLKQLADPQFGITSPVVMKNMMNYKGNFNNKGKLHSS